MSMTVLVAEAVIHSCCSVNLNGALDSLSGVRFGFWCVLVLMLMLVSGWKDNNIELRGIVLVHK